MQRYKLLVYNGISGKFLLSKHWDAPGDQAAMHVAWLAVQYTGRLWDLPSRYLKWELLRKEADSERYVTVTHRIPSDRTKKLGQVRHG